MFSLERKVCSICGQEFEGWGNSAYPINNGTCCDTCNMYFVLPTRIVGLNNNYNKKGESENV